MHYIARLLLTLCLAGVIRLPLAAQDPPAGIDLAGRAPRFMVTAAESAAPGVVDAGSIAVLRRRISLDLDGVTLEEALTAISREAGLRLMYSKAVVPLESRVRLQAERITVAGALTEVLLDAGVDVLLTANGQAVLTKRPRVEAKPAPVQAGTVTGVVTDAKTGEGLPGAEVLLEGTRWRSGTAEDGRYHLTDVEPGSYRLTVRRIGYGKRSQAVTVASGEEVTVDVALEPMPTQLDEVVTTVTGEQRLRELGHVVGRINADSLVKEAPISSLSDLLTSRVSGLQVFQSQGTVGGDVRLQIRGKNSFLLNTEPIVIIDGVRYTSGAETGVVFAERVNPLNDINPNDLESIEVVKGPSAATLYGTDASNGVLVITTKRGRPGPSRWSAYGKGATTTIPTLRYGNGYAGWGTTTDGSTTRYCTLFNSAQGFCTQDSVRVLPNPLNDPDWTIFGSEPQWNYGANVSGGRQDLQYYFSGDYEKAIGPIRMPQVIADQLMQRRGLSELPAEQLKPNALNKINLRSNMTARLAEKAELRATFGYIHNNTRSLGMGSASAYEWGVSTSSPTNPYGTFGGDPAAEFSRLANEKTDRFLATVGGRWEPSRWLLTRGTFGLDLGNRDWVSLLRSGDSPDLQARGYVGDSRTRQLSATAELGATATAHLGRWSARTSIGAQYVRNLNNTLSILGRDLPPGGTSIGDAGRIQSRLQLYDETVTLGSYAEEALSLNQRLFVTGALRVDGASAFGQRYDATLYPKASLSWLLTEEPFMPHMPGLDELRLRYAYGASGQQPRPGWALPSYTTGIAAGDAGDVTTVTMTSLGNPGLRPERTREHELGADIAALRNRVQVGVTWYKRRTVDQIVSLQLPAGLGSTYRNLGLTTQHGFEVEVTAHVLDTRAVSLDVRAQHGVQRSQLIDIGSAVPVYSYAGSLVPGYSLGARFQQAITGYSDANGDGILVPEEVQHTPKPVYIGESTPPISQSLTVALGLLGRRLRLSGLVERRVGFLQEDRLKGTQCGNTNCREAFDRTAPLADQAEFLFFNLGQLAAPATYLRSGDFTRLRELTVAFDLPVAFARALRASSATLSLAGRNLALWTDYPGPDPESGNVSREVSFAAAAIPQGRTWSLRLDLGF